jgi:hypothetical protein
MRWIWGGLVVMAEAAGKVNRKIKINWEKSFFKFLNRLNKPKRRRGGLKLIVDKKNQWNDEGFCHHRQRIKNMKSERSKL